MSTHIINFPGADIHTTTITSVSNVSVGENLDVASNLTVSGNTVVSQELSVSGNVEVGTANLFVDTTTGNVGVGVAHPTSAKLQVAGSLGMAKGSEFFAGDDVVMELPKHDRPLVKYPEITLTSNSDKGYVINRSSANDSFPIINLFNDNLTDRWLSTVAEGDTWNGTTYTGSNYITDVNGTQHDGAWITLKMPKQIKLSYVVQRDNSTSPPSGRVPAEVKILGTNDSTNFHLLKTFTGLSNVSLTETLFVNESQPYNEYAYVMKDLVAPDGGLDFTSLEFWGYEEGDTSVDVVHRSVPNKPGQQHLEVYWDANDSNSYSFADSSSVYDLSGSGVTGTITGTNGFDAEYNAWVFDGSGDYIESGNIGFSGDQVMTLSFWFRYNSVPSGRQDLFGVGKSGTAVQFGLATYTPGTYLYTGGNDIYNTGYNIVTDTEWHHVVAIYTGGTPSTTTMSLYVDNVNVVGQLTGSSASQALNLDSTNCDVVIGVNQNNASYLNGSIANFRLFSKVLNADQVRELYEYDAPRFGHRQNLVSLHKGNLGVGVAHPTSRFEVAGADGIQEYPPRAIRVFDYDTHIESHGVFNFYSSQSHNTYFNNSSWNFTRVFANGITDISTAWHGDGDVSSPGLYQAVAVYAPAVTSGDGVRKSTLKDGSVFFGEWIEMHSPSAINITNVVTNARQNYGKSRGIGKFVILGSNDGHSWEQAGYGAVAPHNNSSSTDAGGYGVLNDEKATKVSTNSNGRFYTHHRLVVTHIMGSRAATNHPQYGIGKVELVNVAYLRFLGTPAPSGLEDGHLTLGKALTLPRVSGHPAGAETPRAESLVVHYDTTVDSVVSGSTVVDVSGNGINGTLTNGAAYSSTDRALVFDGTDDYIRSITTLGSGNISITFSMWIKSDAYGDWVMWLGADAGATGEALGIIRYQNEYQLNVRNGNTFRVSAGALNTWEHLVFIYHGTGSSKSAGTIEGFVNGVLGTVTLSTLDDDQLNIGANPALEIGARRAAASDNYFDGSISNFKLYDVALTAEEVAMEYALGRTGKSLNLTDTSLCLGGTVPRAQLDVRGSALIGGNVGIGVTDPSYKLHVSGGVSYFPDGIATPGYHAQWTLSGGGHVSWDGSNLKWSFRIIVLPVEKTEFANQGYIDIYCPTSGTITYYKSDGTTGTATCTSSGVPVGNWEALWYVITPGQSQTTVQTKFVLTHHGNPDWRPDSNWLLIAVKNGDSASQGGLKFMPTNSTHYTWIGPSFTDSWVNYNTEYNQCGYYKDSENRVYLRGLVKNGTTGNNAAIFVLPGGFRPERRHLFSVISNNGLGRIDITNDGRVRPNIVNNNWVSLDNISFKAV